MIQDNLKVFQPGQSPHGSQIKTFKKCKKTKSLPKTHVYPISDKSNYFRYFYGSLNIFQTFWE